MLKRISLSTLALLISLPLLANELDPDALLDRAIRDGDPSAITTALANGANPDTADPTGKTALMVAAKLGDEALVTRLIDLGSDPLRTNNNGGTPLMFATISGNLRIINVLLDKGADPNRVGSNGWGAVMIAAAKGHVAALARLVEAGGNVNTPDVYLWSPIHRVAYENRLPVMRYLLSINATDINAQDDKGATALHHAAGRGFTEMTDLLLSHGAAQLEDGSGRTPESYANRQGHMRLVQRLKSRRNVN